MRTSKLSIGIAAVAVLAAGCAIPGLDPFAVSEPKNLAAVPDPCQLLKPEQLRELDAGPPVPSTPSLWGQSRCEWNGGVDQNDITLSPDTVQGDGIRTAAKNNTPDGKPTHEISGHPAVNGSKGKVRCSTFVATSESQSVLVAFSRSADNSAKSEYENPCKVADNIALMVLNNLPPQ